MHIKNRSNSVGVCPHQFIISFRKLMRQTPTFREFSIQKGYKVTPQHLDLVHLENRAEIVCLFGDCLVIKAEDIWVTDNPTIESKASTYAQVVGELLSMTQDELVYLSVSDQALCGLIFSNALDPVYLFERDEDKVREVFSFWAKINGRDVQIFTQADHWDRFGGNDIVLVDSNRMPI